MGKKLIYYAIFPALLLFSISFSSSAQEMEYTVYYKCKNYNAWLDEQNGTKNSKKESLSSYLKNMEYTYCLVYKNGKSVFRSLVPEGRVIANIKDKGHDVTEEYKKKAQDYTYKNHLEGVSTMVLSEKKTNIPIAPLPETNNVYDDGAGIMTILGHECRMLNLPALMNRNFVMWVTEDLPVNNEPFVLGFHGIALMAVYLGNIYIATEILDYAVDDEYFTNGSSPTQPDSVGDGGQDTGTGVVEDGIESEIG